MIQKIFQLSSFHKKNYLFEMSETVSFCFNCSTAVIRDKSGKIISAVKPLKYYIRQESALPLFLITPDYHQPYMFYNKSGYLEIRGSIVKKMKSFCNCFKLTKKTFFLALDYLDRICSRMMDFDEVDLNQIYQLCIILASKFQENGVKGMEIKNIICKISNNYSKDELYLLQLLNYDLHIYTSYDILMDILHTGFLFNNENFCMRKMHSVYGKIENMLYLFAESKHYIDWTHKERALAIIGFIRETLGLVAFSKNVQLICMHEFSHIHNYLNCLNRVKKCFKFCEDNKSNDNSSNHSDSITDANSDNNSDNVSESNSDNNSENISENNNVSISIKKKNNK